MRPPRACVAGARDELRSRPLGCDLGCKLSATERNSAQLSPPQSAESQPYASGSLRLGAGRSQVQILSPRSEEIPANGHVLSLWDGIPTGNKRGTISSSFGVVQAHDLALGRGPKALTGGREAPTMRCARSETGWSHVEWLWVVVPAAGRGWRIADSEARAAPTAIVAATHDPPMMAPTSAPPSSRLDRRPTAARTRVGVRFAHGVASGDPLTDRVVLWTPCRPPTRSACRSAG